MLLSSHVLPEAQRACDTVAFVREGTLVAIEDVGELTGRALREIEVTFAAPVPAAAFLGVSGVTAVVENGTEVPRAADRHTLRLTVSGPLDAAVKKLAQFDVVTLTSREPDLEDVFLALYGENPGYSAPAASGAGAGEEAGHVA